MLRKSLFVLWVIIPLMLQTACSEEINSSNNNPDLTKEQAAQKSQQIVKGTITKSELETENGIKVWEVYMTANTGGELKLKFRVDDGTMVEIKGTSPSFDYEVRPGMNLINYSAARFVALNVKNGDILEWKLEKDESNNRWEYRFDIRSEGKNWEVRIAASSGVVLRIT